MSAGVVIVAAGAGARLGGVAKATLEVRTGVSFLEAVWTSARAGGCDEAVVVVAEPHLDTTRAEAARLGLSVAINRDPSRGMASSVAIGFDRAMGSFASERALLWPVDHPAVRSDTVSLLLSADKPIVIPVHAGRGGHPTCFERAIWPELARCTDRPDGARSVVRADPNRAARIDVEDAGVVRDVDTPRDLR